MYLPPRLAPAYRCSTGPALAVGDSATYPFTLRIDRVDAGRGSVQINVPCDCDDTSTDLNAGNDTAPILVNATEGGSGGGLPMTGPAAAIVAGGGGLLLLAGAVGIVIAWRRRTRFVS
jgi:LPXTG-motif cell wall-anchored protein